MTKSKHLSIYITLFSLGLYLLTFGGTFHSIDEELYLRMTQSVVRNQSWAITPIEYGPTFSVAQGLDGAMYGNRNPGLPILSIPFFSLGDALTPFSTGYTEPAADGMAHPTTFTLTLTLANALITALTVFLLFHTVTALNYRPRTAAAVTLLFALGTMAWPYASKSYFGEPLLMLCTLAAVYCAIAYGNRLSRVGQPRLILVAACGFYVGYAVFTKVTALALVPFLLCYLIYTSRSLDRGLIARVAGLFGAVVGVFLALLGWYNLARFGNLFKTGYEAAEAGAESLLIGSPLDLFVGFYGLLLAPGKGLLIYALPVVIGALGFAALWRAHRSEALLIASVILATLAGVVLWRDWSGGWCWGPRLILNIVPLAIIPAAAALERGPLARRWVWPAFLGVGCLIQALGVLPNYLDWYMRVRDGYAVYYDPHAFPVFGHLQLLLEGKFDLFWLRTETFFPGAGPLMMGLLWVLLVATIMMGLQMMRGWRSLPAGEEDVEALQ